MAMLGRYLKNTHSMNNTNNNMPTCQTCGQGSLKKKKTYRMSMPVVVIGYLLLIPCVIGMLIGIMGLFGTGAAVSEVSDQMNQDSKAKLEAAQIPTAVIESIEEDATVDASDTANLSQEQLEVVEQAKLDRGAQIIGTGLGAAAAGGVSIVAIIFSFIGGLIGWLLIMKKKVLQCNSCSAIVSAS